MAKLRDHRRQCTYANPRPTLLFVLSRTGRRLIFIQVWDVAATMTFYLLLSVLPGIVAILSLVSLIGMADETVATVARLVSELLPSLNTQAVTETLLMLVRSGSGAVAFTLGLIGLLYSSSNVIAAFHRAMHRIYDTREGRPYVVFRFVVFVETLVLIGSLLALVFLLILGGDFSVRVGEFFGLAAESLLVWNTLKWPLILLVLIVLVSLAYYRGPNAVLPRYRIITAGGAMTVLVLFGLLALTGWLLENFAVFSEVLYTVNGLIYVVTSFWVGFMVLLGGAIWDAEFLRARQLSAGQPAWEELQLATRFDWVLQNLDHAAQRSRFISKVIKHSVTSGQPVTMTRTAQLAESGTFWAINDPSYNPSTGTPFHAETDEEYGQEFTGEVMPTAPASRATLTTRLNKMIKRDNEESPHGE